jgi:predicted nuclease of predicted toxin-antitoxin system
LKFKLDENLDARLASAMQAKGLDGDTVLSEGLSGTSDEGIFEVCKTTDRVLITLDLDFANPFRFPPGSASGIIVLRPQSANISQVGSLLFQALDRLNKERIKGRRWIVEPGRVRVYEPEDEQDG